MLPPAGALALVQRGKDRSNRIKPGEEIGNRHAGALRLAIGVAGDRHQPGHALNDVVIAGAMRIGPVLPETGDRAIDKARIDLREARIIQPVFRQPADLEVLDQDIGLARQCTHPRLPILGAEIGDDARLATIAGVEIGRRAVALAIDEWRTPGAGIIAPGAFDLDHLGTEIGQRLPRPRAGKNARELDHLETGERGLLHSPSAASMMALSSS